MVRDEILVNVYKYTPPRPLRPWTSGYQSSVKPYKVRSLCDLKTLPTEYVKVFQEFYTSECLIWKERHLWSNLLGWAVYLPRTITRVHVFICGWYFMFWWSLSCDQKYCWTMRVSLTREKEVDPPPFHSISKAIPIPAFLQFATRKVNISNHENRRDMKKSNVMAIMHSSTTTAVPPCWAEQMFQEYLI